MLLDEGEVAKKKVRRTWILSPPLLACSQLPIGLPTRQTVGTLSWHPCVPYAARMPTKCTNRMCCTHCTSVQHIPFLYVYFLQVHFLQYLVYFLQIYFPPVYFLKVSPTPRAKLTLLPMEVCWLQRLEPRWRLRRVALQEQDRGPPVRRIELRRVSSFVLFTILKPRSNFR